MVATGQVRVLHAPSRYFHNGASIIVIRGVSSEFINVKKSAGIDYDVFSKSCSGLSSHLVEIKKSVKEFGEDERGGFV
ncbi:Actin-binding FH2 [Artemisia annua]|uniref:Actin-binding FH2 n=1 Tax=Artemisia annua TaxID=35608 RepID=A0A2U1NX94_ARTAN|nr:Actin-binding FH2 [Artemisia annua]